MPDNSTNLHGIVNTAENHICTLERADAVLEELITPFESNIVPGTWQAAEFVNRSEHFLILMYVVKDYMRITMQGMTDVVDLLYKEIKHTPPIS